MKHSKNNDTNYIKLEYQHFAEKLMFISKKTDTFKTTYQQVIDILYEYKDNSYEFSRLYLDTNTLNVEQLNIIPSLAGSVFTGLLTTFAYDSIDKENIVMGIVWGILGIILGISITTIWTFYNNRKAQKKYYKQSNKKMVVKLLQEFCDDYEKQIINNCKIENDAI